MLEGRLRGMRLRLSLLFPAWLTVLLLTRPDAPVVSCVLAAAIHEGGHLLAMLAVGCPPDCCTVGAFGVRLETGQTRLPGYGRQIVISLAGPAVNLAAAGILYLAGAPSAATVHALLGGLNLLPAAAMDGGQILRAVLCLAGREQYAERVLRVVSAVVLFPLATAAGALFLSGGNLTLLIVSVYMIVLIFIAE